MVGDTVAYCRQTLAADISYFKQSTFGGWATMQLDKGSFSHSLYAWRIVLIAFLMISPYMLNVLAHTFLYWPIHFYYPYIFELFVLAYTFLYWPIHFCTGGTFWY